MRKVKKKNNWLLILCSAFVVLLSFALLSGLSSVNKSSGNNSKLRADYTQLQSDYNELVDINTALVNLLEENDGVVDGWSIDSVKVFFEVISTDVYDDDTVFYSDTSSILGNSIYLLSESRDVVVGFLANLFVSDGVSSYEIDNVHVYSLSSDTTPEFYFLDENGDDYEVSVLYGDLHNIPVQIEIINSIIDEETGYITDCDFKITLDTSVLAEEVE